MYDAYIGIDYSGAATPLTNLSGLQVFASSGADLPHVVFPQGNNWNRHEICNWLVGKVCSSNKIIVGIDHAFSFPLSYFERYGIESWEDFIEDFINHWPTHVDDATVNNLRYNNPRTGSRNEFRLTEKWTSSAKSVFQFDIPGQVAPSTHAGIPWLYVIRREIGNMVHFWPFDGFDIPSNKSVIVEVYPSIFRNRYPQEGRSNDQHDAYSISRWLSESDQRNFLERYFNLSLTSSEKDIVMREGWIIGIC